MPNILLHCNVLHVIMMKSNVVDHYIIKSGLSNMGRDDLVRLSWILNLMDDLRNRNGNR